MPWSRCCALHPPLNNTEIPCRALEHLKAADQLEPAAVPTAMLRLTVCLAAGDVDGAAAAVASLATAPDADADVLRIACCQCLDAGAKGAARTALERLLARCAAAGAGGGSGGGGAGGGASADCEVPAGGLGAPGYEATVFQNLVQLLLVRRLALQTGLKRHEQTLQWHASAFCRSMSSYTDPTLLFCAGLPQRWRS